MAPKEHDLNERASGGDHLSVEVHIAGAGVVGDGGRAESAANSFGLMVDQTYKITKSEELGDGVFIYELLDSTGNLIVGGNGDTLIEALLGMAVTLETNDSPDQ